MVVNEVLKDLMNSVVKSVQLKEQKKRRQYTAKFKAKVIYESESTEVRVRLFLTEISNCSIMSITR